MKMNPKPEHHPQLPGRNEGFTLVEILIAMIVFFIGILGLMKLQVMSIQGITLSNSAMVAGTIAQRHMENIIKADFRISSLEDVNVTNNHDLGSIDNADYQNIDVQGHPVSLGKYRLVWNVADDTPIPNTKTIVVLVAWDHDRRVRKLSTIKSRSTVSIR